jgi:FkbM family methyltransferase
MQGEGVALVIPFAIHDVTLSTASLMRRELPNFIAVGVMRSGTTWLHEVLAGHIGLPRGLKETDFFLRNYHYGMDWYKAFFEYCAPDQPIGELCPTYFSSAETRRRIKQHIPDCRIICTFREPVERAYSHYKLLRHNVFTRASFEEVASRSRDIAEMNRYAFHLRGWQETFGREHVLVALYDDLEHDPQAYLDAVCNFIGIPLLTLEPAAASARVHSFPTLPRNRRLAQNARHLRDWLRLRRAYRVIRLLDRAGVWRFCFDGGEEFPPLDPQLEGRLRQKFRPEVDALEELIGRDLSAWKLNRDGTEPARPPYRKLEPGSPVRLKCEPALRMVVHSSCDKFLSARITETGEWEPFETELVQRFLQPGDVFVDIGANIGWYTIIGASRVGPQGHVYAFEPSAENWELAARNLALNDLQNATLERAAVADHAGRGKLFLSADNLGDHRLYESSEQRSSEVVAVTSLETYFADKPHPIRLVKMDTQGSEARIFRGMPDDFIRNRGIAALIVEFWPFGLASSRSSAEELLSRLSRLGLQCYLIQEEYRTLDPIDFDTLAERARTDLRPETAAFVNLLALPASNELPAWLQDFIGSS